MKKTIYTLLALVAGNLLASAASIDLSPGATYTAGSVTEDANGITSAELALQDLNVWKGTYQNVHLVNQVSFSEGSVMLSIGAAADQNEGNSAALRFESPADFRPAALSFDIIKTNEWGANLNSFNATYNCDVFGYKADNSYDLLGSWELHNAHTEIPTDVDEKYTIQLGDVDAAQYTSYGVIFSSDDRTTLISGAGIATAISNITLTDNVAPVPEPAMSSLSLLGLAAMLMRRRRA